MTGGLLFTSFTFPTFPGPTLDRPSSVYTRPGVLTMQRNNRNDGTSSSAQHINLNQSNTLFQIVFQYEEAKDSKKKYYHSFTINKTGWADDGALNEILDNGGSVNSDYVKISEYRSYDVEPGIIGSITLELTAPYPLKTQVESFLDYRKKIDHYIGFASDKTIAQMAYSSGNSEVTANSKKSSGNNTGKNYHNINVSDNYMFAQELLCRLDKNKCYENLGLSQRAVYIYIHEYDKNFPGTIEEQLGKIVKKYRVAYIDMELSDWRSSNFIIKEDGESPADERHISHDYDRASGRLKIRLTKSEKMPRDLMVGPRKAKFIFYISEVYDSTALTTHDQPAQPNIEELNNPSIGTETATSTSRPRATPPTPPRNTESPMPAIEEAPDEQEEQDLASNYQPPAQESLTTTEVQQSEYRPSDSFMEHLLEEDPVWDEQD